MKELDKIAVNSSRVALRLSRRRLGADGWNDVPERTPQPSPAEVERDQIDHMAQSARQL
jgi:hypothetical protein